ncbi:MAG: hypothetical protein QG650_620 [Patescibacteria group bacterium]|nr:hypothetical protein [Patescibacteria group bacterium]
MRVPSFLQAFAALVLVSVSATAHAAGISISPLKFEYSIETGKETSGIVKVTNDTGKAITLYTSKEDFVAGDDSGTPSFVKPQNQGSDEYALSNWISIEDKNLTLAQGETREIRFKIKAPSNAEPGGHYGAIFFSPAPDKGQVAVVQRLGALVLVDVPGEANVSGNLSSFEVGSSSDSKFQAKSEFQNFPISFSARFKNDGNVHLKPTGKIELVDETGEVLKSVGKESVVNPQGVFIGEKLVDYLPVNDGFGNVLPKSERRFESLWEGFGYPVVNDDGTKTVKFKTLSEYYADKTAEKQRYLKFYESVHTRTVSRDITANLSLSYEGKDKIKKDFNDSETFSVTYEEQYVGVDYSVAVFGILILSCLGYYLLIVAPRSKERLKAELLESMRKEEKEGK